MLSPSDGFLHHALLLSSDDELVRALCPFVRDGLAAGEPVVTVVHDRTATVLSDALGGDQARVQFIDAAEVYENPRNALRRFGGLVHGHVADGARAIRVLGEVPFDAEGRSQREWMRYESALNDLFATAPLSAVCLYDRRALPDDVLASAERTHPLLATPDGWEHSTDYTPPAQFLREVTAWEHARASRLADLTVGGDLSSVRDTVRRHVTAQGATPDQAELFVNAVNEVLTNAMTHGEEPVRLRLLADEGALMCEVSDHGTGVDDPLAAYRLPPANEEQEGGRGLWLARELCDTVELESRPDGFAVHLAMNLDDGGGLPRGATADS